MWSSPFGPSKSGSQKTDQIKKGTKQFYLGPSTEPDKTWTINLIQSTQNRIQWGSIKDRFIDGTIPYWSKNLPDVPISKVVQATYQKWLTAVNCCLPRLKVDRVWPEPIASVSKRDFLEILESVQIKSIWRVHNWPWFRLLSLDHDHSWSIMFFTHYKIVPPSFVRIRPSFYGLRTSEWVY